MIISTHGLMGQDKFASSDGILEQVSIPARFQMSVDSMEKYLYKDTDITNRYFESCKNIIELGFPIPDSSLFDFVIQEIYYATLFGLVILILLGAFYQKRRFNRKLKAEVSKRTMELKHANIQLINTNNELDEFNRILSHDLKEPIRSLVGFSTLLKKKGVQSQEANEYLGYIEQSGKHLYETLSAVSAFQNTVPQEMPIVASVDIAQLSENIIRKQQDKNPDKKIKYSGVKLPIIHSYRSAIHTIFEELINNALRFNQSEVPTINIHYTERSGHHCFEFEDNGIGIAPEFQQQIFGMFKRLNGRDKYGGAGLGLNVALKMARRLDGDITIVSSEEDKGSIFQFTFPIDS